LCNFTRSLRKDLSLARNTGIPWKSRAGLGSKLMDSEENKNSTTKNISVA
jgi:hypothetical protein